MAGKHAPQSTRNSAEIPGNSLFSGRSERFVDSVPRQDVGTMRTDAQGSGHRKTGRSRRTVCDEQARTPPLRLASEAYCFGRNNSLLGSNVASSPQATLGRVNG